jgi:hypothetical protein
LTISTIAFFLLHGTQARERGEISIGTTITNRHIGERGDRTTNKHIGERGDRSTEAA